MSEVCLKEEKVHEEWEVSEMASKFGVSEQTVYAWLNSGRLAGSKHLVSGQWEIPAKELGRFDRPHRGRPANGDDHKLASDFPCGPLLTVADVAARYGITTTTVHSWIRKGHLPAFQAVPRGSWYIRSDLLICTEAEKALGREER